MDNHQWRVYFRLNLISNSFIFSVCVWSVWGPRKLREPITARGCRGGKERRKNWQTLLIGRRRIAIDPNWLGGFSLAPENQQQLLFSPSHSNRHLPRHDSPRQR